MSQAVKILLVSSHPVQYAAPLYRLYSADLRLDVTVAYCSLQGAEPGIDPEFGVEVAWDVPLLDGYRWVHLANRSLRPSLRGFFGLVNPGLWRLVRQGRFDVVVCYGYRAASFWIAALAAKVTGASLVFTTDAHSLASRDGRRWKIRAKRLILPCVFGLADGVFVASSRGVRLLNSIGLAADRVHLTPDVADNAFFMRGAAEADRAAFRCRWGVTADQPVALFSGKLVSWKRPGDLLEAGVETDGLYMVFAGEGPLRRELEVRVRKLRVTDRVRFLGFVNQNDLPRVYVAADWLVLPSESEPFGLIVNEAFACGRPAIVSEACGAVGDLVVDGVTGFVVPVGDTVALTHRLRTLAFDPELRQAMGEKARARIVEWGPEQNAKAFAEACIALNRRRKNGR